MFSFELTKLLSLLVFPLSQSLALMLIASLARFANATRFAGWCALLAFVWLFSSSTGFVADALMSSLESDYPPRSVERTEPADAIVVLGGATNGVAFPSRPADMNAQSDRLLHAVELYKADKAGKIIVAGGSRDWEAPEAVLMSQILVAMGVPVEAIIEERRSRNTFENARFTAEILQEENLSSVLLVTSAFHMRRAEAMFRMEGVMLIPSATDYQIVHAPPLVPKWLPTVENLQRTTLALKEYVGFLVFALGKA
ncbi:MAG: YdcF family protein [Halioglobus sp.]